MSRKKELFHKIDKLLKTSKEKFIGKDKQISWLICSLLCRGHVLIEDYPGVGKTTLALMMAQFFGMRLSRIQFTNDLLPSDILGTNIFSQKDESFSFKKGPIFGELILADELNRTTPKTQSALLQAMEEGVIDIDGKKYQLDKNFTVIATQNPSGQIGTYPLPESQIDRFFMSFALDFPTREFEKEILKSHSIIEEIKSMKSFFQGDDLTELREYIKQIEYSDELLEYLLNILHYGRSHFANGHCLSPRCGRDLLSASQAMAFLRGGDFILPDDVKFVAPAVLGHRLGAKQGIKKGHHDASDFIETVTVL